MAVTGVDITEGITAVTMAAITVHIIIVGITAATMDIMAVIIMAMAIVVIMDIEADTAGMVQAML